MLSMPCVNSVQNFQSKVINTLAGERAAYISALDVVAAPNADLALNETVDTLSRAHERLI